MRPERAYSVSVKITKRIVRVRVFIIAECRLQNADCRSGIASLVAGQLSRFRHHVSSFVALIRRPGALLLAEQLTQQRLPGEATASLRVHGIVGLYGVGVARRREQAVGWRRLGRSGQLAAHHAEIQLLEGVAAWLERDDRRDRVQQYAQHLGL